MTRKYATELEGDALAPLLINLLYYIKSENTGLVEIATRKEYGITSP